MKEKLTQELVKEVEQELKTEALTVVQRAKAISISDQFSYEVACHLLLNEIKPFRKRWTDFWRGADRQSGPLTLAYRTYESILEKFNQGDKPLKEAEDAVATAVRRWEAEQARIREELQRQAQLKAEEDARIEAAKQAEFAAMSGVPDEEVEAIASAPVAVVAAPVEPTFIRTPGVVRRLQWKARVIDIKKLCAAIGKGLAPTNFVVPNDAALNARANSDRETMNIPGVVPFDPNR